MKQWVAIIAVLMTGCSSPSFLNQIDQIPNAEWGFTDPVRFSAKVLDTSQAYNYSIQVRHGGNYDYQNLIVFFKTYYPNNTYIIDTVDCPLAEPNGRWLGSGLGDIIDNRILFKINQRFPQTGEYNFEIQHAMRMDTVYEIYDVGLLISSAGN